MRIDASRLLSIKSEFKEVLKNLEIGDTLKGRVLEALGDSIAIRTASGQIFTAILTEGARIPKGATVELIISSIADGKIYAQLQPEAKTADLEAKVAELLRQLSLPVDEKNMEAAKLLIKYQLPVNREVITNITALQKSIDNLNQSTEGRVALMLSGLDIKNTAVDVLNKIVIGWPSELESLEAGQPAAAQQANSFEGSIAYKEGNQGTAQLPTASENQKAVKASNISEITGSMKEKISVLEKVSAELKMETVNGVKAAEPSMDNVAQTEAAKGTELLKVLEKLGIDAGSEVKKFAGQVADILASIKGADMEALTYLISKDMKVTPKNLGMLMKNIENADGISKFLDKLQQRINASDNHELKEIKASIRKVFLEPHQVEDSKGVSEQLKDIAKLGGKLESYLNSSGNQDPEIRDALSNLRDNIDFIRSINENSNYMQVPLLINGDTSTAKLYVFKEGKRSKAINPENATVLVALDLKNLGHLESMIGIKGKAVNVTFRVENNSIGTLIEKQSLSLKNSLKEKGYSLSKVRVIDLEQPFSLLSLENIIGEGNSAKLHFDMRV